MILFATLAAAGIVGGVLPGTATVGLLVCDPDSPCVEEARWLDEHVAEAKTLPVLFFAEALGDSGDAFAVEIERSKSLETAVGAARVAWDSGHVDTATHRLDEAERSLAALTGIVAQQTLFDLYYLRGAIAVMAEEKGGGEYLAQAAATAWNRTVVLPQTDGPVATAYRDAQHRIMHVKPGKIALVAAPTGSVWSLNGVEVGVGGELTVLPGTHRVVAAVPGKALAWVTTVVVKPEQIVTVEASFPPQLSADALGDAVRLAAVSGTALEPLAAAVLRAWREQRGIATLRVYVVGGDPRTMTTLKVQ